MRLNHDVTIGVEFGARVVKIDNINIKLQIWDTVHIFSCFYEENQRIFPFLMKFSYFWYWCIFRIFGIFRIFVIFRFYRIFRIFVIFRIFLIFRIFRFLGFFAFFAWMAYFAFFYFSCIFRIFFFFFRQVKRISDLLQDLTIDLPVELCWFMI